MPGKGLLLEVRFVDSRYHGVGDWPPSPFRLFQALVAAAYGGRWVSEPAADKDAAFTWLEQLPPPTVAAPAKREGRGVSYFVPNNDLDAVSGDPGRAPEIRVGKTVRPILFDAGASFLYAWPFESGGQHAERICAYAERLHTLGRGGDAAFGCAEALAWAEVEERLLAHGGAIGRPAAGQAGGGGVPCPAPGSLESLKRRHAEFRTRFVREGKKTLFRQPRKASWRGVAYYRPPAYLCFDLLSSDGSGRFRPAPQEVAAAVTIAVRDLAAVRLSAAYPARSAQVERLVVGRGADGRDIGRRIRILPLGSIGHAHATSAIRRVLVEVPPDCPFSASDFSWSLSGQALTGFDRADAKSGEVLDETVLIPAEDGGMLRRYGVEARAVRRWRTVTPAVLPEPRRRGRLSGGERIADEARTTGAVTAALRHAGFPWRDVAVRTQLEPFHARGARADAFLADRFDRRALRHVEVTFSRPVKGPVVIGDGRYLGLGVMAPISDEDAPALHIFAIDPAQAPPTRMTMALARALRRAVMARVDAALPQGETLPTFFSGHAEHGGAARSRRHQHLFFIADDSDGDGRLDRLAVVAPHLADRTIRVEDKDEAGRRFRTHLQRLDEALAGFTHLRAGAAGAPRLAPAPSPDDADLVFGRSRIWVSRTPYRTTRHPRRCDRLEEAVCDDLLEECFRRGFPRPAIRITEVAQGPRGAVTARARLTFAVAVTGPVLLGAGSHFGAGLFAAS